MGLHFPVSFIILIRLVNIFCYCEEKSCCVVILLIFGGEIPKLNIIFKGVSEGGRRGGLRFSFGGQLSAPIVVINP